MAWRRFEIRKAAARMAIRPAGRVKRPWVTHDVEDQFPVSVSAPR